MHNVENVMAAITIVKEFNVPSEVIKEVVSNFKGVEHRLEFSGEVNTRRFYNDTEATNIKCTNKGTNFDVVFKGDKKKYHFETKLLGNHNVYNILAAIACGKEYV